jgi:hypothetical protein
MDLTIYGDVDAAVLNRGYRLFTPPAGTLPFDRNFGIDMTALDDTPAAMEGALLVEYTKKLKAYFPTLKISSLTFLASNSTISPKVVIAYV